jgi:hypothetical protein
MTPGPDARLGSRTFFASSFRHHSPQLPIMHTALQVPEAALLAGLGSGVAAEAVSLMEPWQTCHPLLATDVSLNVLPMKAHD